MNTYLVITMSKTDGEVRKGYVEDVWPHGTYVEEYIDGIIAQFGDVHWGAFLASYVNEETAMRDFLDNVNWCNLGDMFFKIEE